MWKLLPAWIGAVIIAWTAESWVNASPVFPLFIDTIDEYVLSSAGTCGRNKLNIHCESLLSSDLNFVLNTYSFTHLKPYRLIHLSWFIPYIVYNGIWIWIPLITHPRNLVSDYKYLVRSLFLNCGLVEISKFHAGQFLHWFETRSVKNNLKLFAWWIINPLSNQAAVVWTQRLIRKAQTRPYFGINVGIYKLLLLY